MEELKIENLTFLYPQKESPSLKDINLSINQGEFVTVCGRSGCGKTTLLRHLKPMLAPNGKRCGAVCLGSRKAEELSQKEQAEKIGFVMQNPECAIVCDKVWHELAFGLESLSYPNSEIRARVAETAAFFGIQGWYYKDTSELSGGQKQLLCLASVMVMQPSVLVLDEPTSQLDPISAHNFLEAVAKINRELGTTVILSEHRLEEALPLSDRVVVMECGRIVADGDVKTVGSILKKQKNDMFLALPTPMRVYYSIESGGECPLNICEGREWLKTMPVINPLERVSEEGLESRASVLELKDIWFSYQKDAPYVLKGLSLTVFENEFYTMVGGNGAGKTTALSVMLDINKPHRGRIWLAKGKRVAALPQNPQSLFLKDTVLLDLKEMLEDSTDNEEYKERRLKEVAEFCGLEALLDSHPYDLSGGEQQRAALAKVLLCEPDILLLDEPTKGLDAYFKQALGKMLKKLHKSGITIIMVSHDIEFCARFSDRVAMFFDGQIVSEGSPREFLSNKSFYTTAAGKMARSVIPNAVLDEDIIKAIGGEEYIFEDREKNNFQKMDREGAGKICTEGLKEDKKRDATKLTAKNIAVSLFALISIALTILVGLKYFGDRRYYLISTLVLLETMIPFAVMFEGRSPQARELVIIAVICAMGVLGRIAFAMLPQFKPVLAVVIIAGVCFGAQTGFLIGAITAFVSNFYFVQGPWTPWQMLALGMTGFLAGVVFDRSDRMKGRLGYCIFGFFATVVVYGGIMNSANVIISQQSLNLKMFVLSFASGLPMDLVLAAATVFFLWLAAEPMCKKLERIKIKYGLYR